MDAVKTEVVKTEEVRAICACPGYCPLCLTQMIRRVCAAGEEQFHPAAWARKSEILDELEYLLEAFSLVPYDPGNLPFIEFVRRVCYAAR